MKKQNSYKPPHSISRKDYLIDGNDAYFRRSIYALVQCVARLLACRDAFGRKLDLTPSQFDVLMGVAHAQGTEGVMIKALAEHVMLASTHVTTEVGRLERAGLLAKRLSESDRRSVRVSLRPRGEAEIARIAPFVRLVNDVLFKDIDPDSLCVAHKVARKLILNSEMALAEIRCHNLESAEAIPAFGSARAEVTTRATKQRRRGPSRAVGRVGVGNGARHATLNRQG